MVFRYVIFGHGIGAVHRAIDSLRPLHESECVFVTPYGRMASSKPASLKVYTRHFGSDVLAGSGATSTSTTNINPTPTPHIQSSRQRIDLFFARLSGAVAAESRELFTQIQKWQPRYVLLEGMFCMPRAEKEQIERMYQAHVRLHMPHEHDKLRRISVDATAFSGHVRKKTYWMNWSVACPDRKTCVPNTAHKYDFRDYLDPATESLRQNYAYQASQITAQVYDANAYSDTGNPKCRGITTGWARGLPGNVLVDRRFNPVVVRRFTPEECERLLGFPTGWTSAVVTERQRYEVLGAESDIPVLRFLLETIDKNSKSNCV